MKTIAFKILIFPTIIMSSAIAAPDEFQQYRPHEHPYPQIIHASDSETIRAIQTLGFKTRHFQSAVGTLVSEQEIHFTGETASVFTIAIYEDYVLIDRERFSDENTVTLFSTMLQTLQDHVGVGSSVNVISDYWRSEGFVNITEILLNFDSHVLFIGENSGGADGSEQQYVLDVMQAGSIPFTNVKLK